MRLDFSKPAARDLEDIIEYISLDSPNAAEGVYRAIIDATGRLQDFPNLGRPGLISETRQFTIPSLPYVIVYRIGTDGIMIIAVFHGARDLARALADRMNDPNNKL